MKNKIEQLKKDYPDALWPENIDEETIKSINKIAEKIVIDIEKRLERFIEEWKGLNF